MTAHATRGAEAPAVRLDGVSIEFAVAGNRLFRAVEQADLTVAAGEFVAIVGPTGCGKSTLLNASAGLVRPADGTVSVFGDAARRPQPPVGLPVPAGRADALEDGPGKRRDRARDRRGRPRGTARERAREWLGRVGLAPFADRYPHMLSGGQRKRVALAQVLIRDPEIVLMDEPFGPLDAQTRLIMGDLLLRLWSENRKAVIFVTHDLEEAISLADRVVIMSAGPAARIIGDFPIPLDRPRDISEIKLDPAFQRIHREIWHMLKTEVLKTYPGLVAEEPA